MRLKIKNNFLIIYIHGFGSSAYGSKSQILKEYYRSLNIDFLAPSLPTIPFLAIENLKELIIHNQKYYENICLIGSSLGGFYSIYLSNLFNLEAVLINPAINPDTKLAEALGFAINYHDLSKFEWTQNHLNMLKEYKVDTHEKIMLLVQKADEVLNPNEAIKKFDYLKKENLIIEDGGNHSFKNIESKFDIINKFFGIDE
jgi:predicted esterase YcpF (UPF0227 family)